MNEWIKVIIGCAAWVALCVGGSIAAFAVASCHGREGGGEE